MRIRVLIADDEPLARGRIRQLLADQPDVEIVAECGDGLQTVEAVLRHQPDLLFLDVQMPLLTGLEVLEKLPADRVPAIVFVTAYDRYALQAFEVHALDYLLKPYDADRFQKALARARAHIERATGPVLDQKLAALLADVKTQRKAPERIMIKSDGRVSFLRVEEVDWIEAAGNYVRLHVGPDTHLLRETMNGMEARLDGEQFVRIHRSTMVQVDRIQELQPWFHGDYIVVLRDGTQLTMSRGYRPRFQERFGQAF